MNAPQMLQRMRIRSQLLLKPQTAQGLRRQPSVQSYRSENNSSHTHQVSNRTFRSKFERILQQKKVHLLLDTQHSERVAYNSTTKDKEISQEVTKSKKSLNDLTVQRKSIEEKSKRLKFSIQKLKSQKASVDLVQKASQTDVKFLVKRDHQLLHIEEQCYHDMLCYEEMRVRNRQQTILWKARYQELERYDKQYQQTKKQLFSIQFSLKQQQQGLYQTLNDTAHLVEKASQSKEEVFLLHQSQIQDKRDIDRWKNQRGKQKQEFKQLAGVQQQKEQIKEYRSYYLVNKFLLKLMKSKGERIMQRYKNEHTGFEYIRKNTGLNNTNNILERMQSQDQLYEQKLKQISQLQGQLKAIEERESTQLQSKMLSSQQIPKSTGYRQRELDDKLQRLKTVRHQKQEQVQAIMRFQSLFKSWVQKTIARTHVDDEDQQNINEVRRIFQELIRKYQIETKNQ